MSEEQKAIAERLRLAFDMFAAGEEMMRLQLRREDPQASAEIIESRLFEWLQKRPGAEDGDAFGKAVPVRHT